jgi:26S proteasome regulatory subunit N1
MYFKTVGNALFCALESLSLLIGTQAYALLSESVNKEDPTTRIGAIMGLGLAYAGSQREEVLELLTPIVHDFKVGIEVAGFAALSLGLVYVGSCNEDVAQSIILALMDRSEAELGEPLAHFLCLGLGLLYLGKQDAVDATMEVAKTLHEKISKFCQVTLDSCAYAGTGNVLKVLMFVLLSCWAMGLLCSQGGNAIL